MRRVENEADSRAVDLSAWTTCRSLVDHVAHNFCLMALSATRSEPVLAMALRASRRALSRLGAVRVATPLSAACAQAEVARALTALPSRGAQVRESDRRAAQCRVVPPASLQPLTRAPQPLPTAFATTFASAGLHTTAAAHAGCADSSEWARERISRTPWRRMRTQPQALTRCAPLSAGVARGADGLITPHGGKLVDLLVGDAKKQAELLAACQGRVIELSDRNACDVELLTVGCAPARSREPRLGAVCNSQAHSSAGSI